MRKAARKVLFFYGEQVCTWPVRLLSVQLLLRLLQCMRCRGLPVRPHVILLLPDGVEQKSVAADVDVGLSDLPASIADHPALDVEGAAAVQFAEDAEANQNVLG